MAGDDGLEDERTADERAADERAGDDGARGDGVVLSVRGEAQRSVAPDSAVLSGQLVVERDSKPEALAAAAAALDRLTAELSGRSGVPLAVGTERAPLTWSAFFATTRAEGAHDETGRYKLTGRITATVDVAITARDLGLLDTLGAAFARQDDFDIGHVSWHVDDDNPAWPAVRADAIAAAVQKGRDYAAALGVTLTRVDQVADTGLLGGGDSPRFGAVPASARRLSGGGDVDTPSLDPVPQQLSAVIEARLRTTPADLTP